MHFVLLAGRYCISYVIGHIVVFYLYVSFYLCMCRPMYICTGFTTCICPAFYAAILLINITKTNFPSNGSASKPVMRSNVGCYHIRLGDSGVVG